MRRNPPAKWTLPETVNPVARRCIQVNVPDDPMHIAAFRGAMLALASAYNWADDPTHKAKDVALVWRGIVDSMTTWGCEVPVQFRECISGCGLEYSTDGGDTWTCIDLSGCIANISDERIAAWFDANKNTPNGPGQFGGQPGPGGIPDQGFCQTWHVELAGNDRWLCPMPVSTGDDITVSNAVGGWYDGSAALAWECPNGRLYEIGLCGPEVPAESTDPVTSGLHMELVAQVGSNWGRLNAPYEIPSGVTDQQLVIQANDGILYDNQGTVGFDVQLCRPGWTHLFDFTTGLHGWSAAPGANFTWVSGQGVPNDLYNSGNHAWECAGKLQFVMPVGCHVVKLKYFFYESSPQTGWAKWLKVADDPWANDQGFYGEYDGASPKIVTLDYTHDGGNSRLETGFDGGSASVGYIRAVEVQGIGTEPTWP